jgi:hypothetical protein
MQSYRPLRPLHALAVLLMISGCSHEELPSAPEESVPALLPTGVAASITGSGHHSRIVGGVEDLTTFSFGAVRDADGSTTGQWQYDFRAAGFSMHGVVTCLTIAGNEAWVGGVVDRVFSDDPSDQDLVGVDMWWRSRDNGEGAGSPPDSTTGLGFKFPTTTITAASWCQDQPQLLVLRQVESGNIQIRGH